jgi:hypothetical protein
VKALELQITGQSGFRISKLLCNAANAATTYRQCS